MPKITVKSATKTTLYLGKEMRAEVVGASVVYDPTDSGMGSPVSMPSHVAIDPAVSINNPELGAVTAEQWMRIGARLAAKACRQHAQSVLVAPTKMPTDDFAGDEPQTETEPEEPQE